MGRTLAIVLLTLLPSTAMAAEKALVLTDQEQAALVEILDAATKQGGLSIAGKTTYFLNKLNTAPVVTSQTPVEPKAAPTAPAPVEPKAAPTAPVEPKAPPEKPKDNGHE